MVIFSSNVLFEEFVLRSLGTSPKVFLFSWWVTRCEERVLEYVRWFEVGPRIEN